MHLVRNEPYNIECEPILGDDLLEFHQAVVSTLRDADDVSIPLDPAPMGMSNMSNALLPHTQEDMARISDTQTDIQDEDENDTGKTFCVTIYFYDGKSLYTIEL